MAPLKCYGTCPALLTALNTTSLPLSLMQPATAAYYEPKASRSGSRSGSASRSRSRSGSSSRSGSHSASRSGSSSSPQAKPDHNTYEACKSKCYAHDLGCVWRCYYLYYYQGYHHFNVLKKVNSGDDKSTSRSSSKSGRRSRSGSKSRSRSGSKSDSRSASRRNSHKDTKYYPQYYY